MGEIIKKSGIEYKIGTCEELYYTTFEEFNKLLKAGKLAQVRSNDKPENYIAGSYRFRFPFPDEDHVKNFGSYQDFDRGVLFIIPKSLGVELCHTTKFFRTDDTHSVAPTIGYRIPCVVSNDFAFTRFDWSNTFQSTIFEMIQQRPVKNESGETQLFPVVRCPYCGELSRLDEKEVKSFVLYIWKHRKDFTELQVKTAILAAKGLKNKNWQKA